MTRGGRAWSAVALVSCLHCSTPAPPGGSGGASGDNGVGGTLAGSGSTSGTGSSSGSGGSGTGGGVSAGGASTGSGGSGVAVAGDHCAFSVQHEQSAAIGTVTIVHFSTDLGQLSDAHIEFGPEGFPWSAPVDLTQDGYRTLLLGMKPSSEVEFRIVASTASETCTSAALAVTTGPPPESVKLPVLTKIEGQPGGASGYFVTTPGLKTNGDRGLPGAYVFDSDGDIVWWTPESMEDVSSAQMSWDGKWMWYVHATGGEVRRTSMDGLTTETLPLLAHHDLVALPEGGIATFSDIDGEPALVEVADDGTVSEIARLADLYEPESFHANALVYYPSDDTFTISDLILDGFVKITRLGGLIWQLGGENPKGDSFELVGLDRAGGHGHELGPAGQFLFYSNVGDGSASSVVEVLLDENAWTATKTWEHLLNGRSQYLGGVQRLPSGNTSIVHSMPGVISEVTSAGELVQSFDNTVSFAEADGSYDLFGYARFRGTLYGPPASTWPE